MKLTEKDIEMFGNLNKTSTGTRLLDYLDRLQTHVCDVRNMHEEDRDAALKTANAIQEHLVDKIKFSHAIDDAQAQVDEFE